MIRICRTNSENTDFISLTKELDADLTKRNGDDQFQYHIYNKIELLPTVVIAYRDNYPVGCACFKEFSIDKVELKRMYVKPDYRGLGIADKILDEIEKWICEKGISKLVLETGLKQVEAISFYTRLGYIKTDNYGQYIGNPNSVCMEKIIRVS